METWEDELNEKLALFAGFTHELETGLWYEPDGQIAFWIHEHGFPWSLDACFAWLVPLIPAVRITSGTVKEGVRYVQAEVFPTDIDDASYYARDGNAALALCKAIEKLLEVK